MQNSKRFFSKHRLLFGPLAVSIFFALGNVTAVWAAPQKMHIMEGFLPIEWSIFWYLICIPFWVVGFWQLKRVVAEKPESRLLLGLSGAYTFVLSALKIPSVTGSSSHPTGTGLGTILFGPFIMAIIGSIVLLFQALLLAHGGLTTLGANAFSMAVIGPLVAWGIWALLKEKLPFALVVFLAAACSDLLTYITTSVQLALAFPDPMGGFLASFIKFASIFAITQIPLAISEGILTVLMMNALRSNAPVELKAFGIEGA